MTAPFLKPIPRLRCTRIACAGGLLLCLLGQDASAADVLVVTDSHHPVQPTAGVRVIELDLPERIKAELAQIAECLSVRGFLGSFKAKLAEFAENPICKAALAAGRAFENARDGRRAEKVLVNGAREKVVEMEGLSREMGEWSLLDEVGDMRGARRELDGHEAPARPLDNQVL